MAKFKKVSLPKVKKPKVDMGKGKKITFNKLAGGKS